MRYLIFDDMPQRGTLANYNGVNITGKVYITTEYYEATVTNGHWKNYAAGKTFPLSQFPIDFPEDAEELGITTSQ